MPAVNHADRCARLHGGAVPPFSEVLRYGDRFRQARGTMLATLPPQLKAVNDTAMMRLRTPLSDPNFHFLMEHPHAVGGAAIPGARSWPVTGKLKIGLLVDGPEVPKYVYDLIEWARGTGSIQITHLLIHERPAYVRSFRSRMRGILGKGLASHAQSGLWRLKQRLESRRLARIKAFQGYDRTYDCRTLVPAEIRLKPQISKSGLVYRFSDEDVARIREEGFDLLLRCGSGILRGAILSCTRLGILSFHHGDNRINRGGPAGFWEIYHRQERTGFVLQKLNEELDGGDVILRGYIRTQDTHLLNSATLYAKSFYRLRGVLLRIAQTGELPEPEAHYPYTGKPLSTPGFLQVLAYLCRQIARSAVVRARRALRYRERWDVYFTAAGWRSAVMWRGTRLIHPAGHFLADPFVVLRDGRTCVFAEDFVFGTGKGHITVFEITDGIARELGTALREDFHLSFPYLFEYDGGLFMVPESREAGQIRIYECVRFPLEWRLKTVVMRNVVAADTMIFFRGGLWWMLTNISQTEPHDCSSELYLFSATTPLTDEWKPHPRNPVVNDPLSARNGGLLVDEREVVRVAQSPRIGSYGAAARLFRITRLTPEEYVEEPVSNITPDFASGIHGSHHFHSNGCYSVWDSKQWERI